jgi:endonuclease/exonuclease/phosphatase family metal-dependent hydrolase
MSAVSPTTSNARSTHRPVLEQLEDRTLLSGDPLLRDVTVMSRNLYLGADLDPAIAALSTGDPSVFIPVLSQSWATVKATNFPERAEALADEILQNQPTLVGLQEAELWRSGPALDPAPATHVEYDFVQTLLDKLATRGLHYRAKVIATNWDAEFPAFTQPGVLRDLHVTDRDAILVRTDLPVADFKVSNAQTRHFTNHVALPLAGATFDVFRSWSSVDVKTHGKSFRFITTHLEPESSNSVVNAIQVAQAQEILDGPANTSLPVILAGDFNARADGTGTATYGTLLGAGFTDAWNVTHPDEAGNTCCHAEALRDTDTTLSERIDLVLFRGNVAARSMSLAGNELADRTPSGLWPSDHAGVVTTLDLLVPGTPGDLSGFRPVTEDPTDASSAKTLHPPSPWAAAGSPSRMSVRPASRSSACSTRSASAPVSRTTSYGVTTSSRPRSRLADTT